MNLNILPVRENYIQIEDTSSARRFITEAGEFLGDWGTPLSVTFRTSQENLLRPLLKEAFFDSIIEDSEKLSLHVHTSRGRDALELRYHYLPRYSISHGHLHILQEFGEGFWAERLYAPTGIAQRFLGREEFTIPDDFLKERS